LLIHDELLYGNDGWRLAGDLILFRYISLEVFKAMSVIALVVLVIATGSRLSAYLGDAAAGKMNSELLGLILFYRLPGLLELIIPVSFFLAIMIAHGRLAVDNELTVLKSTGFGEPRLLKMTLLQGLAIMIVTAILALWLRPLAEIGTQAIKADQKTMTEFDLLIPGRFQTMSQGERVTYVRDIADSNELSDVFITELEQAEGDELGTTVVMVADEGETRIDEQGNRLLILRSGKRYRMKPGALGHQVIEFETYGQVLARDPSKLDRTEAKQLATWDLLKAESNAGVAELQWRLSLVLMVPILAFLAVPLARVNPREGRFARIAPALLLCFLYLVLLSAARSNVESGSLGPVPGLFWVHAGFAILALTVYRGGERLFDWSWIKPKASQ
jgi:lipopolysaccharide export system permease protein